ncbi:hypothetical protein AB0B54_32960 [Microbispora bryophytorum]|uniref:DUF7507 domain-containing protein n=1 Tax=Microbispora bryophytorum TaxID=1460882 RepID=UPI0033C21E23
MMRHIHRMCYPVAALLAAAVPLTLAGAVPADAAPARSEVAATVAPAAAVSTAAQRLAAPDPASCPEQVALVNGGFEKPVVTGTWAPIPDASQNNPNAVPGWRTTATDHMIEVWSPRMNVPAVEGAQFAELNANQVSTLYQDRPTTPGQKLYWRLSHRGRLGTDQMALDIGAPSGPAQQGTMSDGAGKWGAYHGTYTVPAGQTTTRFAFRSISAAGGNASVGNFLDDVFFGTPPCVVVTKSASPQGPVDVGAEITYRLTAVNKGGDVAQNVRLTDKVPTGTTYVPGSLRVVGGPGSGALTDQAGDDQAEFDAATGAISFRLGDGATDTAGGRLANDTTLPDGTTVEFRVRAGRSVAGKQVVNSGAVAYENRLGSEPEPLASTSGDAVIKVNPAVDLSVVKSADKTEVTVGETVTYRVTIANAGPNDATGVTVKDVLPANLAFLSSTGSAGTYAGGTWTVGTVAGGATATLIVRAKATAIGETVNTATVGGKELDLDPANDSDAVKVCVQREPFCPYCTPGSKQDTGK